MLFLHYTHGAQGDTFIRLAWPPIQQYSSPPHRTRQANHPVGIISFSLYLVRGWTLAVDTHTHTHPHPHTNTPPGVASYVHGVQWTIPTLLGNHFKEQFFFIAFPQRYTSSAYLEVSHAVLIILLNLLYNNWRVDFDSVYFKPVASLYGATLSTLFR
jgi:hypothetical protein